MLVTDRRRPLVSNLVLSYVYSSFVLLSLYKTFKALLRLLLPFLFGRSEVYRLCDAELKTSKSPGLGSITGLEICTDSETIVSWRNGVGRAVVAPRVSPYTLLRIDQAILYSSKLTIARREMESRHSRIAEAIAPILKAKYFDCDLERPTPQGVVLAASVQSIILTHRLGHQLNARARTRYDPTNINHEKRLRELWDLMMPDEPLIDRIGDQWGKIGFQGKDPATDFRGMGLLGLDDLIYMAKTYPDLCSRILSASNHVQAGFSMAIVGINLTDMALNMVRNRDLQYHFYVYGIAKDVYHEFFCFLFDLFEKEWVKVPGRTVMAFNEVAKALENQVRFILLEGAPSVLQPEIVIETYNPVVAPRAGFGSSVAASEDLENRKNM